MAKEEEEAGAETERRRRGGNKQGNGWHNNLQGTMLYSTHSSRLRDREGKKEVGEGEWMERKKEKSPQREKRHAEKTARKTGGGIGKEGKERKEDGEGEEGDTAKCGERGVHVCITSAVEENCLTDIRRLLNDNPLSSVSGRGDLAPGRPSSLRKNELLKLVCRSRGRGIMVDTQLPLNQCSV
ncbi:unnamed protein product [Pleuronectes platessa]|uniref:Uncharacterized protein n=1 Tax=Pleuronectes platessa TaxID=8262 RepID=A0A9N7YDZ3_PLEPL|nr:unnamed protein product [Pleuronectes platessa]